MGLVVGARKGKQCLMYDVVAIVILRGYCE